MAMRNDTTVSFSLMPILTTFIIALLPYILYRIYKSIILRSRRRRYAASKGCQPPFHLPIRDPFFGLDFIWSIYRSLTRHTSLEDMRQHYIQHGVNTLMINQIGMSAVSTIEPENVKCVLSTNFHDWEIGPIRKKGLGWFLGDGIFTSDGAAWHRSRELLRPSFARAQISDPELFEGHARSLVEAIPNDGTTMVDLQPLFFQASLDIATDFLFGRSTNTLSKHPEREAAPDLNGVEVKKFIEAWDGVQEAFQPKDSTFGFLSLFFFDWFQGPKVRTINDFVDGIVEQANRDRPEAQQDSSDRSHKYVFLQELLERTQDRKQIRAELLSSLLAGRDTTASLLSNVWFELSRRPEVWSKLQDEVSIMSSGRPTFEEIKSMKYLQAILNESLRLYPVVPDNARTAARDTILPIGGGSLGTAPIFVKKGEVAHWSLWAMHRRKEIYGEDAEEFKPERWLDKADGKGLRVGWEYLPFNGGPRICIGQQFALMEVAWITAWMAREFEGIESRDDEPWREKVALTCTGLGGCKVVLIPRRQ